MKEITSEGKLAVVKCHYFIQSMQLHRSQGLNPDLWTLTSKTLFSMQKGPRPCMDTWISPLAVMPPGQNSDTVKRQDAPSCAFSKQQSQYQSTASEHCIRAQNQSTESEHCTRDLHPNTALKNCRLKWNHMKMCVAILSFFKNTMFYV